MKKLLIGVLCAVALVFLVAQSGVLKWFPDIVLTEKTGSWIDTRVYTTLSDAIDGIGSTVCTIHIVRSETLDNDKTIPDTAELKFMGSGNITQTAGTLTINASQISAPERTVLLTTGAGSYDFRDGLEVHSSWFDDFDDAVAITDDDTVSLVVDGYETMTASDALGGDVILKFESAGDYLQLNSGVILSNVSEVQAGSHLVLLGAGRVDFNDGARLRTSWFERFDEAVRYADDSLVGLTVDKAETLVANTTMPGNIALHWESAGNELTINSDLVVRRSSGPYDFQTFVPGTGEVSVGSVSPEMFGAERDGVTDDTAAINAAIASASAANGRVTLFSGTYRADDPIRLRYEADIGGQGLRATTIDSRAAGYSLYQDGNDANGLREATIENFRISHANNVNAGVDMIQLRKGSGRSRISVRLEGNNAATGNGIVLYGNNPDTAATNNNQYNNVFFVQTATSDSMINGKGMYLYGTDTNSERCNANVISGTFNGFDTAIWINGNGNRILNATFGGADVAAVHIEGTGSEVNYIAGCYFDGAVTGNTIELEHTKSGQELAQVFAYGNIGIIDASGGVGSDIVDLGGLGEANWFSQTYKAMVFPTISVFSFDPSGTGWIGLIGSAGASDQAIGIAGSATATSGKLIVGGSTGSGFGNSLSNNGGVSAVINDDTDAEFRVVKTADGSAHDKLFSVDDEGNLTPHTGAIGYSDSGGMSVLTIASGEITITQNSHIVDTEGAAASDELETINASGGYSMILVLKTFDSARDITIKSRGGAGVGNIECGAADCVLDSIWDRCMLHRTGDVWRCITCQDNN